jgi:hypothetical protein
MLAAFGALGLGLGLSGAFASSHVFDRPLSNFSTPYRL